MLVAYASGAYGFSFATTMAFLVPLRALELDASPVFIGIMLGASGLLPIFTSVSAGALADRIGPRQAYILGTAITAVLSLFFAFTSSLWVILVLQLALGPARTLAWISSQTYITGVGTTQQRPSIAAKFSFSTQVGVMAAPIVAGLAASFLGYQASFLFATGLATMFMVMGIIIPDIRSKPASGSQKKASTGGFREALELVRLRGIQVALLLTWIRVWTTSGWNSFVVILLVQEGMPEALAGTVVSSWAIAAMAATISTRWVVRLGSKEVIIAITLGLGALGVAITPHVAFFPLMYVPAVLIGIGQGLSLPLLLAVMSDWAPADKRGVALGIRVSVNQAAGALSPLSMGGLINLSGNTAGFGFSGIFMGAVLTTATLLHIGHRRQIVRDTAPVA
jgi:MFS family permease